MRVIVNVQYSNGERKFSTDLEVPATIHVGDLSKWLANALKIDDVNSEFEYRYTLSAPALRDKILSETSSLASLGLWDGTRLVLESQRTGRKKKVEKTISLDNKNGEAFLESENRKYLINGSGMWVGRSTPQTPPELLKTLIDLKDELQADTVSRKHAQIIIKGNEYFLETPKKNIPRTLINEETLKSEVPQLISNGDILKFGTVVLQFKFHNTEAS